VEFGKWACAEKLNKDEKYLIQSYLDRNKKTIEAGTGGGRILFGMKELGFKNLTGFDFIPEFIEVARQKDITHNISFEIQDATKLKYEDSSFDHALYLGNLLCFIESDYARASVMREAYRILKTNGISLFSFLCFEIRKKKKFPYLAYISLTRKLNGSNLGIQYLPWVRLGGKINYKALADHKPHIYWYKIKEANQSLQSAGFDIIAVASSRQINSSRVCKSYEELINEGFDGSLYFVCKKPS
jgi:ubiquinone/menaquinone biosynthesis C-methylase UbiE